ncbi:ATP-dependent DNA helicase Pif1-like [Oratosquilla oratoria]|uniref:ATP-dependent DNA helicase Pif1-like n=1 Tax=Oratosquilla oratoria TaxID=337810 RepID=UPI003F762B55
MILDTVCSTGRIALAVASSGIAATVLHGGRTAHNMFKIPLMEYNEVPTCAIKKNTEMANKNTIAALDITLRDILDVDRFMGGVPFVCAGDFRQILPVIRGGGKNDELDYCIKSSYFWKELLKLELTENVRPDANDDENKRFTEKLLEIGAGDSGKIGVVVKNWEELVERIYDNFEGDHLNVSYFEKRTIISPTNDDVEEINRMVYTKSNGRETLYISEDTAVNEDGMGMQTSVYNAMASPSLPLHVLKLKIGSIVMVIRKIRPPKLCSGTRIMVTNLQKNIIVGKILSGVFQGEQVLLPRITLESTDTPVHFKRKQFPVKLSYAMTINKSQEQTFQRCGLLLDTAQCFAHGQLYVACSRVTNWNSLIIYTGWMKGETCVIKSPYNCVYKELFIDRFVKSKETDVPEALPATESEELPRID